MAVFVYGTLMSSDLFIAVAGGQTSGPIPAQLDGYSRKSVAQNVVPFITPDDQSQIAGLLWSDLNPDQIARLDLYERAFGYWTQTVQVTVATGVVQATCYMPPDGIVASDAPWSLSAWEADHLAPALLAAAEVFSHDPPPDPDALRRMWPMVEARAWAKHRAKAAPATLRHARQADDIAVVTARPPQGGFFRLQDFDVHHARFDGHRSPILHREVFIAVDAAFLLPYDPFRDKVALIEQVRMGPLMRHDHNPWMLEPVAGIVDARESPEQAARRETFEEAGLTLDRLEPISAFYASPGSSTDYFYCYAGLCDLPQTEAYFGGLAAESEDIRVHPLSFDRAMALADSGEIQTGPLILILNWLARHRDRLRAMA